MLIATLNDRITNPAAILALVQYPIYGLVLIALQKRLGFILVIVGLLCIHLMFFILADKYVEGFS
jgi:hypothetical protein